MEVPSPLGDVNIVSSISTSERNTLTLKVLFFYYAMDSPWQLLPIASPSAHLVATILAYFTFLIFAFFINFYPWTVHLKLPFLNVSKKECFSSKNYQRTLKPPQDPANFCCTSLLKMQGRIRSWFETQVNAFTKGFANLRELTAGY